MHLLESRNGYDDGDTVHSLYLLAYGFQLGMAAIEIQIKPKLRTRYPKSFQSSPHFADVSKKRFKAPPHLARFLHPWLITRHTKVF
jgi:hypothetical protein